MSYDPNCLPDLLPIYYKRLFPYSAYYRWLHYGGVPKTYFSHREFSFTLKDDVYIRYQSFSDLQQLEKEMLKMCPYKIDIGAVFTYRPRDHRTIKAGAFQAQEKELVFDIDMTDYDDVRSCCSGADICSSCWPLMVFAVKILDKALRDDFGFKHLLWVYSGRRGIHCWVCDEVARKLSQKGRTAVSEYLNIVKGGENQLKKVILRENFIHPSIRRAVRIVQENFEEYAVDKQDFLDSDEHVKKVVGLIPDEAIRKMVEERFNNMTKTSAARWQALTDVVNAMKLKPECRKSGTAVEEIMLQYCYPRLDINVSKGVNHLLKSPFCIHPKTGKICVPINPNTVEKFDPASVPTISQLCEELDNNGTSVDTETPQKKKMKDNKQTSLREGLAIFEKFVRELESSWKGKLIEQSDMEGTF